MSDLWEKTLLEASLGDVTFPVAQRSIKTGRDFTRYKYPYRKGQGVEDVGRKTYVWTLQIPLYESVSPSHYPGKLDDLLALIDDEDKRGELEYVDPELGAFDVKIADYDWEASADKRNGGDLTVVLEERAFGQSLLQNLSSGKLSNRAAAAKSAQNVGYLVDTLDIPDPLDKPNGGFSLTDAWVKTQRALETAALAADQVAAKIDEYVLVSQKFLSFSAADELQRWSITCAVYDAIGAAYAVGDDEVKSGAGGNGFREVVLIDDMSVMEIAQLYYGDASLVDLVASANPTPNPMLYPRGTKILVAA